MASVAATAPETLDGRPSGHAGRGGPAAFAVYALLAFLYFGLGPLIEPGRQYVGVFDDPQIPIWSFAWWVHSIAHAQNPLYTHLVWAPTGVDLAWVNTVPAIALAFAPLTALVGPVASYDVAAVLLPALSAWAGFLLCRHIVGRFWPSLVGGYLFGFSSYMLGHVLGQPQLTAVFAVPLIALVVVRRLEGQIGRNRMIVELGLLLALQLWLSAELALTLTIAIVVALVVGLAVAPPYRRRLIALLPPMAGSYLLAAVLAAPLLYYAVSFLRIAGFQPPGAYRADLLNFVIPTHLEAVGAGWAHGITLHFPGNSTEQGAFIGLPLLAIIVLYARRSWRTLRGRFLLVALAAAFYLSLGPKLTVYGHAVIPLPTPARPRASHLPRSRQQVPAAVRQHPPGPLRALHVPRLRGDRRGLDGLDPLGRAALAAAGAGRAPARPKPRRRRLGDDLHRAEVLHERELQVVPGAGRERAAGARRAGRPGDAVAGTRRLPLPAGRRAAPDLAAERLPAPRLDRPDLGRVRPGARPGRPPQGVLQGQARDERDRRQAPGGALDAGARQDRKAAGRRRGRAVPRRGRPFRAVSEVLAHPLARRPRVDDERAHGVAPVPVALERRDDRQRPVSPLEEHEAVAGRGGHLALVGPVAGVGIG